MKNARDTTNQMKFEMYHIKRKTLILVQYIFVSAANFQFPFIIVKKVTFRTIIIFRNISCHSEGFKNSIKTILKSQTRHILAYMHNFFIWKSNGFFVFSVKTVVFRREKTKQKSKVFMWGREGLIRFWNGGLYTFWHFVFILNA